MIDLYSLSGELKKKNSRCASEARDIIREIYGYLRSPSPGTQSMIGGWLEDFDYIYGEALSRLSANRRFDAEKVFGPYGWDISAQSGENELRLPVLAIQTFFALLMKLVTLGLLTDTDVPEVSYSEIITGDFARRYGIENYGGADWYCWPVYELDNGFGRTMDRMRAFICGFGAPAGYAPDDGACDDIKRIYESIIPSALRHALGEYYTPDWLAESVLNTAVKHHGGGIKELSFIDPTCGSGTFIFKAAAAKRKQGCGLKEILSSVRGTDINPLAVLTAKTNYLFALYGMTGVSERITIPVYRADLIALASGGGPAELPEGTDDPAARVHAQTEGDMRAARSLGGSDIVVGNPPWVNWEYLPERCRTASEGLWRDYSLFSAKGRELGFAKEDISVLMTYIAMDKLLEDGGVIGFVIRQGVFKSARNGAGFRRFNVRGVPVKVLAVDELSIKAFENTMTRTALFYAVKGEENAYPVRYRLWEKKPGARYRRFGSHSPLWEVMDCVTVREQEAMPSDKSDPLSPWVTAGRDELARIRAMLGGSGYRARTGVFTGGANAVYWLRVSGASDGIARVSNIVDRAKRKTRLVSAALEKTYIYPMLKGSGIRKWSAEYDTYILCPHTARTKMKPVAPELLAAEAPLTMEYLESFRELLDERRGFSGWEKDIRSYGYYAVLRVGEYTFSKYKVVWKYIATRFVCAVIGSVSDPYLGTKLLLPNEKVMYIGTDDEDEAYYLCGILSSELCSRCVESFMNPTSISAHVLDKLSIPAYDVRNGLHNKIARICREGHEHPESARECGIGLERLVEKLYGV